MPIISRVNIIWANFSGDQFKPGQFFPTQFQPIFPSSAFLLNLPKLRCTAEAVAKTKQGLHVLPLKLLNILHKFVLVVGQNKSVVFQVKGFASSNCPVLMTVLQI